jgi:hypothetical protein
LDYVDALVDDTYQYDNYEYLKIPSTDDDFDLVINSQNWDNDGVIHGSEEVDASLTEATGFEVVGAKFVDHIFKQWFSPYHDFYVKDPDSLLADGPAERGLMYMVKDEYTKGIFQPRYAVTPLIDNMDIFQCGFYKVLMTEWNDDDPWSAWASVFENDEATPVAIWGDNHAALKDALMWVGGGFAMPPEFAIHHSLAAQASYLNEDATEPGGTTALDADATLAAFPFTPFTYHYYWDSLAFTLPTDGWDATNEIFNTTAARKLFEHTFEVTSATRRLLWRALDYFDPFRPNRVRIAGWITNMISLFSDRIDNVTSDIGTLLENISVDTVPLEKDNSRYLSKFRIMGIDKPPLVAGRSGSNRRNPDRPISTPTTSKGSDAREPKSTVNIVKEMGKNTLDVLTDEKSILEAITAQLDYVTGGDIKAELELANGLGDLRAILAAAKAYAEGMAKGATTENLKHAKQTYDRLFKKLETTAKEADSKYAKQKRGGDAR